MNRRRVSRLFFRSWHYFRMGYSIYLTYLMGIVGTLVTVYYLMIRAIPSLQVVFPDFTAFITASFVVGVPITVLLGWAHYKGFLKSAFKAEQDIGTESNPYTTTITAPVNLPWLRLQVAIGKELNLDTSEVEKLIAVTEEKFGMKHT